MPEKETTVVLSVTDLLKLAAGKTKKYSYSNGEGTVSVTVKDSEWGRNDRQDLYRIFEQAGARRYGVSGFQDGCALCGVHSITTVKPADDADEPAPTDG